LLLPFTGPYKEKSHRVAVGVETLQAMSCDERLFSSERTFFGGCERDQMKEGNKLLDTGRGTLKMERKENIDAKPTDNTANNHELNTQKHSV
jgi:hypothetical protein